VKALGFSENVISVFRIEEQGKHEFAKSEATKRASYERGDMSF
jgi:hypothetical protein